jgi:CHAT domain-containing protein
MVQNETSAAELAELVAAAIGDYDFPGQSRGGVPAPPNPERADERAQARTELSRRLIDPIPSSIWRGAKRLVVVPDGPLHRLPFELLSREGVLLADDLALSYAPSLSALDVLRRNGPPERDPSHLFIGFGDPAFEDRWHPLAEGAGGAPTQFARRGLTLPELPATRAEVESAAEIFAPAATTFCGAEATEQSVKSFVEPYAYIHFATHGLLDDEAPLYSGLALAPPRSDESPGDQGPDDFLQVFEIFDLRLSADVVVCSACQTGAGRYLAGEGLIGMTRAFFVAGARNLVVSLWPVPDLLTAKLMQAFYGFLRDGSPVDEALRRAKAGVRRRHPDPYYWAAFITLGAGAAES